MSILQWNLDGHYSKYEELRQLLSISNASVAGLQECKFGAQSQNAPQGFSLYSKLGPNAAQGGVAMLVHNTRPQYAVTADKPTSRSSTNTAKEICSMLSIPTTKRKCI